MKNCWTIERKKYQRATYGTQYPLLRYILLRPLSPLLPDLSSTGEGDWHEDHGSDWRSASVWSPYRDATSVDLSHWNLNFDIFCRSNGRSASWILLHCWLVGGTSGICSAGDSVDSSWHRTRSRYKKANPVGFEVHDCGGEETISS
jgi:hypothetical protein